MALFTCCSILIGTVFTSSLTVLADENTGSIKEQVDDLSSAVKEKQGRVKELDSLISAYRARIKDQESKQTTLANEVLLLDNRIREKELDVQRSKTELEALTLEIQQLDAQIAAQEEKMSKQKELISELIRRTHQSDEVSELDILLTRPSLSSFFDRLEELKRLEGDLGDSVDQIKTTQHDLDATKKQRDEQRNAVLAQQKDIEQEQIRLEIEKSSKSSLIAETQQSQEEFERVLYELRQQQQSTADDIAMLEDKLKNTLDAIDESLARGDILLNWPVTPLKGLSAHFHDPSYPFRRLFEHPGTDIPTPVGTPVKSAAGGYVAWNKTGKQYGNYTMIVHPGGIATIYAHLSKFMAKPDTYIERGDVIGLSGGRPGDPGAGLSTGAHLHFEVRQGGIPVDAENFLPSLQ